MVNDSRKSRFERLMIGASLLAIGLGSQVALAQEAGANKGQSAGAGKEEAIDEIVVVGIRASLRAALDIKRDSAGVVDAISAEDIGKFPDTNLAESLQRITGVSIDRSNGEGSRVTVRGFGPDFNLVLLNGRQMPGSSLGSGVEAPASRSFDFANLASEGISGVEVYKSGRATLQTGGIGSVINIKTPRPLDRPGFQGSIAGKGVIDHTFEGTEVTPEFSGIISKTFADDRIGILLAGSYQRRKASLAQFNAGWREGYLGSENNWGSLAQAGDPRFANITNRPGANDVYQVTQNAGYDLTDIDRERFNGQAVLQFKPTDTLSAVFDYTFAQHTIDARTSSIGVWFNHNNTTSSWTNGPVAGPVFYSEAFGAAEGKDLAITGSATANRNLNHSVGGNLRWDGIENLRLELDAHHSTAVSKPTSPYGSSIAVGSAIYGVQNQRVDFTSDLPVISVSTYPGAEISAANIRPAGNAFRNAYMRDRINEISFRGNYEFDSKFIDSLDFGATYTHNRARSAFGVIQNDTWGGTLSAAATPDDIYTLTSLPDRLSGIGGANDPSIIQNYFQVDTVRLIELLRTNLGICGTPQPGNCRAQYTTDRRTSEGTIAPYIQSTHSAEFGSVLANLRLGLRYERTNVNSSSSTPLPAATIWASDNEVSIVDGASSNFLSQKGFYDNWLPAIDFDVTPISNLKLRASYSHTLTRADYASLQGGITVNRPLRPFGGSTAYTGDATIIPYKSKNVDVSAEWYYGKESYISVGFFHKSVSNFIANVTTQQPLLNILNPAQGAAAQAARAALGGNPSFAQIRDWVRVNRPQAYDAALNGIISQPGDPTVPFTFSQARNNDRSADINGWEFAVQHSFWDTGVGVILNYTIVNSNTRFDNTLRYTETQFAINGISDSANAVLFYDKNGIQARVAYNWRDGFLANYGFDPFYVQSYGQLDISASWEFRKGMTVFFEGINVASADRRGHQRNRNNAYFAAPGYGRYSAGLRYSF